MLEQRFPRALLLNENGEDRVIRDGNFEFLGAPVGSPQYMSEEIRKRAAKASSLASEIAKLNDPQVGLRLLKHCASFCKIVYTMRTVPPQSKQRHWTALMETYVPLSRTRRDAVRPRDHR